MPPPHHQSPTGTAGRLGLAVLLLVGGVILALGPGSAALAERVAQAAQAGSPARTPTLQPRSWAPAGSEPGASRPRQPEPAAPRPRQRQLPAPGPAAPGPAVPAAGGRERVPPLRMPLAGPLLRGFDASAGTYGPGHRGVDVGGRVGEEVRAPAGGRVEFAGPVAGVTWVSVLVAPGVTVTVGPLLGAEVTKGQRVRALAPVGRLGPGHSMMLHLGLRVDGIYVDPLPYLVDRPRPRLAPLPDPGGLARPDAADPIRAAPGPDPGGP
jgi:murein DD-endopeptidase MepM/ murein hydrolase activator NlpD